MTSKGIKLYLLTQRKPCKSSRYDKAQGFVIAAKNTTQARELASQDCGDEGPKYWLDPKQSRISRIATSSKYQSPRIVLGSFLNG